MAACAKTFDTVHSYLIALGSNIRHIRHGAPRAVLAAAIEVLGELGGIAASAPVISSRAVGPSRRDYANGACVLECNLSPQQLLAALKGMERQFGMRRGGRWSARVLDLDIILWSGGIWATDGLTIPHPLFRERDFVLGPASAISPGWKDPLSNLSLQQLNARLTKPRAAPR